jgi:FMN phosphatase YigB (HAD superfamily)
LWRRVPEPADVFLLLGDELAKAGKLAPEVSAIAFAELRRAAERAARAKVQAATGYREVTLADIYAAMPEALFADGFDRDAQAAAEVALERLLLIIDEAIVDLIRTAKDAGAKVILVSDTYFTSSELRAFLNAAGAGDLPIDRLYASCEAGRPKYRDLFDTVLANLGVAPGEVLHIGDSHEADIAPCAARQIPTVHYEKWTFLPRVQHIEFPRALSERRRLLAGHGDFGLTGLRARLRNRVPAGVDGALTRYWQIGACEFAPAFAGFARWIVGQCAARGATKIFGIMREGRFLGRLVAETARALNVELTAEEVWLSRRAVIGAAVYPDDLSMLGDLIAVAPGETPEEVLRNIGLTYGDLSPVLPGFDMHAPGALNALAQAIAATPALRDKVVARATQHRANLLKGLAKHIDLGASEIVLLMDLGYAATIQSVLARILAREGATLRLEGFYLALNDRALLNRQAGTHIHAFIGNDGFNAMVAQLLSRTPDVLEHACMCREGSLARYGETGDPILLPNLRGDAQLRQMEALQEGIVAGVQAVNRLLGDFTATPHDQAQLKRQIARLVEAMVLHPTTEEAKTIGTWQHEANFDLTDRRRLIDLAIDPAALEYRGLGAMQEAGRQHAYWPAAAFLSVSPFLGEAYAAGAEGAYRPEHLTSGPLLGVLGITPDLGIGFDDRRAGAVPLALNAFGRGEIKVTIKGFGPEAYSRIKLSWPAAQAVIALLLPVFVCQGEQEVRVQKVKNLTWSGAREIAQGVQFTTGAAAETIIELSDPPPFAHALEVTMRFKYLRLTPMFGAR